MDTAGRVDTVLVKTASRCNFDCSYCYVYHGADSSWRFQPKRMGREVAAAVRARLVEQAERQEMGFAVVLHGGEPLLARLPPARRTASRPAGSALASAVSDQRPDQWSAPVGRAPGPVRRDADECVRQHRRSSKRERSCPAGPPGKEYVFGHDAGNSPSRIAPGGQVPVRRNPLGHPACRRAEDGIRVPEGIGDPEHGFPSAGREPRSASSGEDGLRLHEIWRMADGPVRSVS